MPCPETVQTQAYFDGEVDAVSAHGIERHLEGCAGCRLLLEEWAQLRTALRRDVRLEKVPRALRDRVLISLAAPDDARGTQRLRTVRIQQRSFWTGAATGVGASVLALLCVWFWSMPSRVDPLVDDLVGAHLGSLMPNHLIDVVSTDRHTVKPWFAGHADVSPAVADFETQGFRLAGGRADYVAHQRAAVIVYQRAAHIVNVFVWAAPRDPPQDATRNGYHLAFWRSGNLVYCAVSDASWESVFELKRLLQDAGAHDGRE